MNETCQRCELSSLELEHHRKTAEFSMEYQKNSPYCHAIPASPNQAGEQMINSYVRNKYRPSTNYILNSFIYLLCSR